MDDNEKKAPRLFLCFFPKQWAAILSIFFLSIIVRVPYVSYPPYVIFDEVHFGGFLSDYIRGICFFDIHPPLAKLILAGTAKYIAGYKGDFNFSKIDTRYTDDFYVKIRLCPAILTSFAPPLLTAALLLQHCSIPAAFLAGFLFTFEFAVISQSRLILTDGILYFFVCLSVFMTALEERYESGNTLLICQALAASFAFCTKFTSAGCFILIAFSHLKLVLRSRQLDSRPWFAVLVCRGFIVTVIFLSFLYTVIVVHLKLLPNEGFGDRYMQADFRQLPMYVRVVKLLQAMYRYNAQLSFTHPYQSKWYQWPIVHYMPIFLFSNRDANMCLLSNPVSAFLSLVGFFIGIIGKEYGYSLVYLISYLPFILVERCVFMYHYEIPLIFGLLALCKGLSNLIASRKKQAILAAVISAAALACFAFWFPWIYAYPASIETFRRMKVKPLIM